MTHKRSRRFAAAPESVAAVRAFVREAVHDMDKQKAEDIELLSSELASNVVEHAGRTDYEVRVLTGLDTVTVEVADGSSILPAIKNLAIDAERGRGLKLLQLIAQSWGTRQEQDGKTVWFKISSR